MISTLIILLVASAVASSCALVGTFLVLRQMALLGDAISHAVLPGIVIAFLITGERAALPMVIGAGALGVLTVFLVELATRTRRLREDASIGVVFPALFAVGVIMVSRYASQVDLDLDCVLYGEIAYAPLDVLFLGGRSIGPKALWVNGLVLLANAIFIGLFYKELKVSTFDAALAAALGFAPTLVHYLLMTMVSITVVGAFESVGAILVVAMLIVPPAAAYLWTERLSVMIALSVTLGIASAILGYGLAYVLDASIAGAMATAAGLIFLVSFLIAPDHGLLARLLRNRRLGRAMAEQLLMLHLSEDATGAPVPELATRFSWTPEKLHRVVGRLESQGWVARSGDSLMLTPAGLDALESSGRGPLRHTAGAPVVA